MDLQGISPISNTLFSPGMQNLRSLQDITQARRAESGIAVINEENNEGSFQSFLDAYMSMVEAAGRDEMQAQQLSVDFALSRHDDMLAVILAQERAYSSMFFTTQITSRFISAYQEIMRMQL